MTKRKNESILIKYPIQINNIFMESKIEEKKDRDSLNQPFMTFDEYFQ